MAQVGAVSFRALSPDQITQVTKDMKLIKKVNAVRHRDVLQIWSYRSIWCSDARRPQGGRPKDTYDFYANHSVDGIQGITALFAHARVIIVFCSKILMKYLPQAN